jgi:SAM-dependent methyltransferase
MFIKSLKTLKNSFSKGTVWFKITLILTAFLIIILLVNKNTPIKEGFAFDKKYIEKRGESLYDDFYVSVYDELVYSGLKNEFELGEILNKTSPTSSSKFLDVGSGTGHHVKQIKDKGFNVIGVDKSSAMVNFSKENYPDIVVKKDDVMNSMAFQSGEFTHITCLYFTIYYIKDKSTFFSNCMNWLKPGGYLILHLVDKDLFDPIIPSANPFIVYSPQKYTKERLKTSNVVFNNFTYKGQFDPRGSDMGVYPNDFIIYREIFKDTSNGNVRENTHQLYMDSQKNIINKARTVGFIESAQVDMASCQYENQYLYILQKPV